jgi:hypothetical protein
MNQRQRLRRVFIMNYIRSPRFSVHLHSSARALTVLEVTITIVALVIIAFSATAFYYRVYLVKQKTKTARADLKNANVALLTYFVDICNDLYPDPKNYLSHQLTTPVGYLKALPLDPFSRSGETFRYVNQESGGNCTCYVLASRGPDGDWDVERLPLRFKVHEGRELQGQVRYVASYDRSEQFQNFKEPVWVDQVKYYIKDDKRVDVPQYELMGLPKRGAVPDSFLRTSMTLYLAQNGIAVYDPTNGLKSDGDIVIWNR